MARGTGRESQHVIDALDVGDAGDALDVFQDALELFAVVDVEGGFDAGVEVIRAAVEVLDIGADSADDAGDAGEQAGAVLGVNAQGDGVDFAGLLAPLHL